MNLQWKLASFRPMPEKLQYLLVIETLIEVHLQTTSQYSQAENISVNPEHQRSAGQSELR